MFFFSYYVSQETAKKEATHHQCLCQDLVLSLILSRLSFVIYRVETIGRKRKEFPFAHMIKRILCTDLSKKKIFIIHHRSSLLWKKRKKNPNKHNIRTRSCSGPASWKKECCTIAKNCKIPVPLKWWIPRIQYLVLLQQSSPCKKRK